MGQWDNTPEGLEIEGFGMRTNMKTTWDKLDKSHRAQYMREKTIEQQLVKAVRAAGGICPKLISPGFDGMPDRMVLLPGGRLGFVEVKAPGRKPRPIQELRHRQLRQLGFKVYVLDSTENIRRTLESINGEKML